MRLLRRASEFIAVVFCVHVHSGGLVAYELFDASLRLLESSESRRMYAAGCVCWEARVVN